MKAVVIREFPGASIDAIRAVYPRHRAVVDAFKARGGYTTTTTSREAPDPSPMMTAYARRPEDRYHLTATMDDGAMSDMFGPE